MVNAKRYERKLPSLLVDGPTTKERNWNSLMRNRYRLQQFKKRKPEQFNSLMVKNLAVLNEWKTALETKA